MEDGLIVLDPDGKLVLYTGVFKENVKLEQISALFAAISNFINEITTTPLNELIFQKHKVTFQSFEINNLHYLFILVSRKQSKTKENLIRLNFAFNYFKYLLSEANIKDLRQIVDDKAKLRGSVFSNILTEKPEKLEKLTKIITYSLLEFVISELKKFVPPSVINYEDEGITIKEGEINVKVLLNISEMKKIIDKINQQIAPVYGTQIINNLVTEYEESIQKIKNEILHY